MWPCRRELRCWLRPLSTGTWVSAAFSVVVLPRPECRQSQNEVPVAGQVRDDTLVFRGLDSYLMIWSFNYFTFYINILECSVFLKTLHFILSIFNVSC